MSDNIPWEAFDETHPDHHEWTIKTGKCMADHDHFVWCLLEAMKKPIDD